MNKKPTTFKLDLLSFSLEFDVWVELSSEWTEKLPKYTSDFVFVVADTYLSADGSRYALALEDEPGNFIMTLESVSKTFLHPKTIPDIENIIGCGELHKWMINYWEKIENESVIPSEDVIYDLLISTTIMNAKEGCISIYRYKDMPIIEVTSYINGTDNKKVISFWDEFDPEKKYQETKKLQQLMVASIRNVLTHKVDSPLGNPL
jgi:hypothetical protein